MNQAGLTQNLSNSLEAADYLKKARAFAERLANLGWAAGTSTTDMLAGRATSLVRGALDAEAAVTLAGNIRTLSAGAAAAVLRPGQTPAPTQPAGYRVAALELVENEPQLAASLASKFGADKPQDFANVSAADAEFIISSAEISFPGIQEIENMGIEIEPADAAVARLNKIGSDFAGFNMAESGVLAAGMNTAPGSGVVEALHHAHLPNFLAFTVVDDHLEKAKKRKKQEEAELAERLLREKKEKEAAEQAAISRQRDREFREQEEQDNPTRPRSRSSMMPAPSPWN